ncbi:hypothetical protein OCU04_004397 [Sclerotinia nivalis]|uniref:Uncharacterized protein n=1 Tax=Sclerotinia nivalis TaxID=352851 RepID=A0A9X0AQC9_9HELO|nr:hypothetical protein OCU04_004397 [Sclerotinia nivalis]
MSRPRKQNGLIGVAKVGVFCSKLDESREVNRGTVEGLRQIFREQNSRDYNASHYIPVLLNETELNTISTAFDETPQKLNRLTIHAKYSDGEVYCNVRHSQKTNDEMEIAAWKGRLTNCKRVSLDQLLKREDITELFDRLIPIPGLWIGLELGNIQKVLALRCDEEITRYLEHIQSVWEKVTLSDRIIQMATDVETVRLLQLRVPFLSRSDRKFINSEMASGKLFPKITDPKTRKKVLEAILRVDCLIPSLKTMHENLKYLEVGAKILKNLLIAKSPRLTIYNALRAAWTYNGELFIETKGKRSHIKASHSNEVAWSIIYKQVWIWALRNFSELGGRAPRKEYRLPPYQPTVDPVLQYEFVKFAKDVGINTRKIESRLQGDPRHKTMLTSICQIYPSHNEDEIERVTARFVENLPIINSNGSSSVDTGGRHWNMGNTPSPIDLSHRWGVPFAKSYTAGKKEFYLTSLSKTLFSVGDNMPSHLFVLQDFIFSFFGRTPDFEAGEIMNSNNTPPGPAESSSYSSVDKRGGPSSSSRAPMNRNTLQSTIYPQGSQSQHLTLADEMDYIFDSSSMTNNEPVETSTKPTPFQTEVIDESLKSEKVQDVTVLVDQEPLVNAKEMKRNDDSQHSIQGTDSHGKGDATRKIPDIELPNDFLTEQKKHNEDKGKRIFSSKPLTPEPKTSSSLNSETMPFNNQLAHGTDIPSQNIANIIRNPETPASPARSLALSEVSPLTSAFEQKDSFNHDHFTFQSGTHNQGTEVITSSRSESARSPALSIVPPELSPNYQSPAESSEQQLVVLPEIDTLMGGMANVPYLFEQETITGREWSPEDLHRSPIMSTIDINPSLWQANVDRQHIKLHSQTPRNRPELLPSQSSLQPINLTSSSLDPSQNTVLAVTNADDQTIEDAPINSLVVSSHPNIASAIIGKDEDLQDTSSLDLAMTLPDEPRRSMPIAIEAEKESLSILPSQSNEASNIIGSDEGIRDESMQDISSLDLAMTLPDEPRRSMPIAIEAEKESLSILPSQSNEASNIIGSDEGIRDESMQDISPLDLALPDEPRRSMPIPLPSEIIQNVTVNMKDKDLNSNIVEQHKEGTIDKSTTTSIISLPDDTRSLAPQPDVTQSSNNSPTISQPEIIVNEFNGMTNQRRMLKTIEDVQSYLGKRHGWALVIQTSDSRSLKTIPPKKFLQHIEKKRTSNDVYYCFRRQHYEKMKKQSRDRNNTMNPLLNRRKYGVRKAKREQLKVRKNSEENNSSEQSEQERPDKIETITSNSEMKPFEQLEILPMEPKEPFPKTIDSISPQDKQEGMNFKGNNDQQTPYLAEEGKRKLSPDHGNSLRKNHILESEPTKRRRTG